MAIDIEPRYRVNFDARELAGQYPPAFSDPNKRVVAEVGAAAGPPAPGTVAVSQWPAVKLPPEVGATVSPRLEEHPGVYEYDEPPAGEVHWYQNFANADVFAYYAGPLLAQDELQVLENPLLASVRHALEDRGLSTFVVEDGRPTPLLVAGVERRVALDTAPGPSRPGGLYGNAFSGADQATVREAAQPVDPPTRSNILAIEAPSHGSGAYTQRQIAAILQTAFSGYLAARLEALAMPGVDEPRVVMHTGFWGCGAYGGNRRLMALLQLIAARAAGLDALVFHTVDESGLDPYRAALNLYERIFPQEDVTQPTRDIVEAIHSLGFEWGVGNRT